MEEGALLTLKKLSVSRKPLLSGEIPTAVRYSAKVEMPGQ
jgi:hypothetical protein